MLRPSLLLATPFMVLSSAVEAEPVTSAQVSAAQVQMLSRIGTAVEKYAKRLHLDPTYISYCHGELALKTSNYPANGLTPFGVNYNQVTDSEYLDTVIRAREGYEQSFMFLCLANAKNTLRAAEQGK